MVDVADQWLLLVHSFHSTDQGESASLCSRNISLKRFTYDRSFAWRSSSPFSCARQTRTSKRPSSSTMTTWNWIAMKSIFIRSTRFAVTFQRVSKISNDFLFFDQSPFVSRAQPRARRLNEGELAWARDQRLKELRMWSIIREVATYFGCLVVLYLATYSNLNGYSFQQMQHLKIFFLNTRQASADFTQVSLYPTSEHTGEHRRSRFKPLTTIGTGSRTVSSAISVPSNGTTVNRRAISAASSTIDRID